MDRGSDKHGPQLDEELKDESHSIESSSREARVEGHKEKEDTQELEGSGSSADDYPHRNRGEEGGSSHPKPREEDS